MNQTAKIIALFLLMNQIIFSQNEKEPILLKDASFAETIENFTINYFYANTMGNNFINKAHQFEYGIAAELHLKVYKNLSVGAGLNHSSYDVTDNELVGNYYKMNHTSMYGSVMASFALTKKISALPQFGYGLTYLSPKKEGTKITRQDGYELRVGTKIVYNLNEELGFFVGFHYVFDKFNVKVNPEIKDFYNHSSAYHFSLGISFF